MPIFQTLTSCFKRSKKSTAMPHRHHHNHHAHAHATSGRLHRNPLYAQKGPNGFAAYARAARRFNFDAPTVVGRRGQVFRKLPSKAAGTSGSESEVPANDIQGDLEYVVPVSIGTPGVTLNLDFDTGKWIGLREISDLTYPLLFR